MWAPAANTAGELPANVGFGVKEGLERFSVRQCFLQGPGRGFGCRAHLNSTSKRNLRRIGARTLNRLQASAAVVLIRVAAPKLREIPATATALPHLESTQFPQHARSEERRGGKECRS